MRANQIVVLSENAVREYLIWDTAYSKDTLQSEVEPAGFRFVGIYDDVTGAPYTGEADTLCGVWKK